MSKSRLEKIELAKIKFPSEFEEWEKCKNELEEITNQLKNGGEDSQSFQDEFGKLNVTILLLAPLDIKSETSEAILICPFDADVTSIPIPALIYD